MNEQFEKRPWAVIAGAVALGYAGGTLLMQKGTRAKAAPVVRRAEEAIAEYARALEPEIARLKSLALGALFGAVREFVAKSARSAPEAVEEELEELIDGITVKLGGTPTHHHGNGARKTRSSAERRRDDAK